jgi:OOP family OmpA-OmpF porin
VTFVRVDGRPEVASTETFGSQAGNEHARRDDFTAFLQHLQTAFGTTTRARTSEADPLGALSVAARATPPEGNVVLLDSGLQTAAPLRFQDGDGALLDAEPDEIVTDLKRQGLLPDLHGRSVLLAGLGNTADPQPELNTRQRNNLAAIWQAIAKASGARCVDVLDDPAARRSMEGLPAVSVVPIAAPPTPPRPCGDTQFSDRNNVGFLPDQADFRDEAAARTTIQTLADVMRRSRQTVELIGATASVGSVQGRRDLSRRRAEAVRTVLVDLGIPADRITTRGVGTDWSGHVPDLGPGGALLPGPAAENRKVIARLRCPHG